jgi:hypothetical protein
MVSPLKTPLSSGVIDPQMKFITQAQVDRLIQLYYPLWQAGGINLKTLLGLLPDIDPEQESENYYIKLAKQSKSKGLAAIFNMLAFEEAKHYKMLEEMKTKTDVNLETLMC